LARHPESKTLLDNPKCYVTMFLLAPQGRFVTIAPEFTRTPGWTKLTEDVVELQAQPQLRMQTPSVSALASNPFGQPHVDILSVTPQKGKVELVVRFPSGAVHTAELPGFAESMAENLPAILCTRCHSGNGGTFAAELPHTETGHVLEHAILAHLEHQGLRCRAITEWNWRREPWGTFHIAFFGKHVGVRETLDALRPALAVVESAILRSLSYLSTIGVAEPAAPTYCQLQPGLLQGGEDPDQDHA
jgi:hypothetical protein